MSKSRKKRGKGKAQQAPKAKVEPTDWQVAIYEKGDGTHPAQVFLDEIPKGPRRELLKTVAAVIQVGPLKFPAGRNGWQPMHKSKKKGEVNMRGIVEARDKHDKTLYRLFCILDRDAQNHGLSLPSLVLIGGAKKPIDTVVSQAKYREIDENRQDYFTTHRVKKSDMPDWFPT